MTAKQYVPRTRKQDEIRDKMMEIYNYIDAYCVDNGYPPSVREICTEFGIKSTATVYNLLNRLESEGYLKKGKQLSRALEVVNSRRDIEKDVVGVPLLGSVAAGIPSLATESEDDVFPLPVRLFGGFGDMFMLTVKGESMIDAGIFPGDKLVVRSQSVADNGQIVVAMVGDEATVKRFYKENKYFRLHPENSTMRDMIFTELTILGVVVGMIRTDM